VRYMYPCKTDGHLVKCRRIDNPERTHGQNAEASRAFLKRTIRRPDKMKDS
jgi:hypothetical protein